MHSESGIVFTVMLIVLVVLASLLGSYADDTTTANLLWPKPYSMQFGSNVYQLSPDSFQFTSAGAGANSDVVGGAFARYYRILFQTNAPFYPTGATEDASGTLTKLVATVDSGDETLGPDTDESCKSFPEIVLYELLFILVFYR